MVSLESVVVVAAVSCWLVGPCMAQESAGEELLKELAEARLPQGELRDPLWWREEATRIDAACRKAFAEHGVQLDADDVAELVSGLAGGRSIELSTALDYWALARRESGAERGDTLRLLEVAAKLDSDPWRNRLRRLLSDSRTSIVELQDLADAEGRSGQPPASLMTLAQALQSRGETELAVEIYEEAVESSPSDVALGVARGVALELLDPAQTAEAVEAYRKMLELRPDHVQVQHRLAVALQEMRDRAGALAIFQKLMREEPENAHWPWHAGWNVSDSGDKESAKDLFRRGIALDPDFERPVLSLGNMFTPGDDEIAIAHYRKALEINPSFVTAYNNLGIGYRRLGDLEKSWQNYLKALSMAPDYSWSRSGSRSTGRQLLDADKTIASYRARAESSPHDDFAQLRLGLALRSLGRSAEAVEVLEAAHALRLQRTSRTAELSSGYLEEARSRIAEEAKLLEIAEGHRNAESAEEQIRVANLLSRRTSFAAAASAFIEAMRRNPGMFNDVERRHRYHAARAAVMAGTDQRENEVLAEADGARWREQALAWLRADLAAWSARSTEDPTGAEPALKTWMIDPALEGVRIEARLAVLPKNEADRWQKLWSDVSDLLERIR